MVDRNWTNIAQLEVTAPDQASAQAYLEVAMAAIKPVLAALTPPVTLVPEVEEGMWVLEMNA